MAGQTPSLIHATPKPSAEPVITKRLLHRKFHLRGAVSNYLLLGRS